MQDKFGKSEFGPRAMSLAMTRNNACSIERTRVSKADTALSIPQPTHKRNTQEKGERPLLQRRHSESVGYHFAKKQASRDHIEGPKTSKKGIPKQVYLPC